MKNIINKLKNYKDNKAIQLLLAVIFIAVGFAIGQMDVDTAIQLIGELFNVVGETTVEAVVEVPTLVD